MLDQLQERLALLKQQIEQYNNNINQEVANLNMLRGAEQELLFLIEKLGESKQQTLDTDVT